MTQPPSSRLAAVLRAAFGLRPAQSGRATLPASAPFSYRADVDGLRAIAVLSVVGFHAVPEWVAGGFVGVDIFFVISGYLISGIILSDLASARFTFGNFYTRRIKRIFPALSVVLLAVLAYGWLVLLSDEYAELGKHVAAGAGFVSNLALRSESGYFDTAAELKPLLHLWSLGIEEQFYLIWPLCLLLSWRYRGSVLGAILVLGIGSFAANIMLVGSHPESVYYLPLTRFWELLVGAALAYLQIVRGAAPARNALRRDVQAITGALLIAAAIVVIDRRRLFPGWWALLPTLGTGLIIAAGPDAWINRRLLSQRAVVYIGLISYPLYLWHWPLLSFARIIDSSHPGPAIIGGAVVLAFLLAAVTYRFIEMPIRTSGQRVRAAVSLAAVVAVLGTAGWLVYQQTLLPRSAAYGLQAFVSASHERAFPGAHLQRMPAAAGNLLEQGAAASEVVFLGDSNIEQYYPRIDKLITENGGRANSAVFATSGGCMPILQVDEAHHPGCSELIARGVEFATRSEVKTVVIGAAWSAYLLDENPRYEYYFRSGASRLPLRPQSEGSRFAIAQLEATVRMLVQRGKQVYIVLQIPIGTAKAPESMIQRDFLGVSRRVDTRPLDRAQENALSAPVNSLLINLARTTGAHIINPLDSLCSDRFCPVVTSDDEPMYRDAAHLRPAFVTDHIRFLDRIVLSRGASGTPR